MADSCPKSQYFPRDRRLTVSEQMDLDAHARQMWVYMNNKVEDEKLTSLQKEVRAEERKLYRALRKQKRALKKAARSASRDSGYSSGSSSQPESLVPVGMVPNPFYQGPPTTSSTRTVSPTGVTLVPNPFFIGTVPSTAPPAISQSVQLIVNPFFDPVYVAKNSK